MTIDTYVQPNTIEEAYQLAANDSATIVGGLLWLRLMKKNHISCAVDCSKLGLDHIEQTSEGIRIGAYASLRAIETSIVLNKYSHGAFASCTKNIVGVQFRNLATMGGSIAGRFGFSDLICVGMSLGMEAEYYHNGRINLEKLMQNGNEIKRDILTHVWLPDDEVLACAYVAHRNTATDFPVLNVCVTVRRNGAVCTVGARPGRAVNVRLPDDFMYEDASARESFAQDVSQILSFGSNGKASADYRKAICAVLVRRALEAVDLQLKGEG